MKIDFKKYHLTFFTLFLLFCFGSCDILRTSLFEVVSWTPGSGYHNEPENIILSFKFSHDPHIPSVERNFSLNKDGNRVRGIFIWNGKTMIFRPLNPLEKNADYTITISADARDTNGLSMDSAFNHNFTTRADNDRPVLLSYFPSRYEEIDDLRTNIILEFSLPIPLKSLYENISFVPSMAGYWQQENGSKTAIFYPSDLWIQNNRYEIRISSSLTDNNGMNIRNSFTSVFITGTDHDLPYLVSAHRLAKNGDNFLLIPDRGFSCITETPEENPDWEKDDRLLLVFSKPVDSLFVRNYVNAENAPNLIMETFPGFETEFIFRFERPPVFESRFALRIRQGIRDIAGNETKEEYFFRIVANGKFSKPPKLTGIRIPMAPKGISDCDDDYEVNYKAVFFSVGSIFNSFPITDEHYPSGEDTATWIELYFSSAEGTSIDVFSVMDLFRLDTSNNVITFSPRWIRTENFTIAEPEYGREEYQRIEIGGNLRNTTNFGIINFHIGSGLQDSIGNRNDRSFTISVIK